MKMIKICFHKWMPTGQFIGNEHQYICTKCHKFKWKWKW